jgi:hypothetical protein
MRPKKTENRGIDRFDGIARAPPAVSCECVVRARHIARRSRRAALASGNILEVEGFEAIATALSKNMTLATLGLADADGVVCGGTQHSGFTKREKELEVVFSIPRGCVCQRVLSVREVARARGAGLRLRPGCQGDRHGVDDEHDADCVGA